MTSITSHIIRQGQHFSRHGLLSRVPFTQSSQHDADTLNISTSHYLSVSSLSSDKYRHSLLPLPTWRSDQQPRCPVSAFPWHGCWYALLSFRVVSSSRCLTLSLILGPWLGDLDKRLPMSCHMLRIPCMGWLVGHTHTPPTLDILVLRT
jgi:hypothetical protein